MLSAKQAREKTESNQLSLKKASIEKLIQKAIEKGQDKIFVTGGLNVELIDELKENGYSVIKQATGMKISW